MTTFISSEALKDFKKNIWSKRQTDGQNIYRTDAQRGIYTETKIELYPN